MKSRNKVCLLFSIISMGANILLFYALTPGNFFLGYDIFIYLLGIIAFTGAGSALYFAIPHFDDEAGQAHPLTRTMLAGIGLGAINLVGAIVLTPLVFVVWGLTA